MNELFGATRAVVKRSYALLTPDGFVASQLPGWKNCTAVVNISPEMGAKFAQIQITLGKDGEGAGNTGRLEYFIYVLAGKCTARIGTQTGAQAGAQKHRLVAGSYVLIPPETHFHFGGAAAGTRLLVFQKPFVPLAGAPGPAVFAGQAKDVEARPFLGHEDARLQVLLPDRPEFDLAVNIFTYQPGATLPFVESHIMEHGMLLLAGQGIYRLEADWHPVQTGDVIWLAPYCLQWFVAMGPVPASYIYYKDVNRAPLA